MFIVISFYFFIIKLILTLKEWLQWCDDFWTASFQAMDFLESGTVMKMQVILLLLFIIISLFLYYCILIYLLFWSNYLQSNCLQIYIICSIYILYLPNIILNLLYLFKQFYLYWTFLLFIFIISFEIYNYV